ncbi:FabD/lysophospholipase-like protein [Rickenella mellea]|uniref:Lysophospholipase n=1 Tax=Rickenella mellea TaxID=50990 RepID=A0A4Y7Q9D2_9AGAM|nr:FabD/lysophospholipase-like protein [Rickenella mellea]
MSAISSWTWPASFSNVQAKFSALFLELSRGPDSLYSQIVNYPPDPAVHPECQWDAEVRLGDELCISERAFLKERRRKMKKAFARQFGVPEDEIDERDLPIVALAGSGGGYRAMINTTGSLVGADASGLLDCITYTAGISGSCWALGVLYSEVAGNSRPESAARHLAERLQTSYLDMETLDMLITSPTNKYLISGLLRKATAPLGSVSLTDVYGTLVSARLFVPSDLTGLDPRNLSLHQFRRNVDNASLPMPIFTAVLHEVPVEIEKPLADAKTGEALSVDTERKDMFKKEAKDMEAQSRWLWFEFTPFEIGCDELGAWIPAWALGRRFEGGRSIDRNPELSFTILSGIYASAFCATLNHYFVEIQPVLRQLPAQLYAWLAEILDENDKELATTHAVMPNELPNFVKGLTGQLRDNSPRDITERETLGFMPSITAELNIPYYPLLRRDVDCIIALDASADSQDLWFTRAEEYALKRGLSKWPRGARWPALAESLNATQSTGLASTSRAVASSDPDADAANRALAETQEKELAEQTTKQSESQGKGMPGEESRKDISSAEDKTEGNPTSRTMSACTIWMGSSTGSQESSKMDELEEQDLLKRDGIAIVYNPLIPNDVVPNFDPLGISTFKTQMDRVEVEKLLKVSEANFSEGREKIVRLLKAIWLRKKAERELKEDVPPPNTDW